MTINNRLTKLKTLAIILGIAGAGIIISPPGWTQTSSGLEPSVGLDRLAQAAPSPDAATPATPVSQEELQQFANAIAQLITIEQSAQQQFNQALEQAGLSRQRFSELYTAQRSPDAPQTPAATPQEQQSYDQVIAQIQTIGQRAQSQKVRIIQAQGLEPERFNAILAAVQQDPSLQERVQQLLNN